MTGTLVLAVYVFVLAAFLGYELLTKVPPMLHTPLMSGANAMSGVAVIGALILAGTTTGVAATVFATSAVALATANVVGGFMVTDRMLSSFTVKRERA
ncbi:NAD(P) transhydrogenase subunit alpha [Nocardiopsis ganjiahuensis]|uniref:NAD(P) transhydrogenase subunit alpha n=1 Tax=Nocardiopsis ganjiahuensis TaxID=239984 RepID=UPI0003458ADE|nr:NAD(P) transhydrogenase subunit alpha [Nocardiopsis ganjiahuensis]